MSLVYKLEKFEGPLDLLLQLIESADLDITEVALSKVADQFMEYLEQVEEKNSEEMADFLVVASRLLLIKSRILMPALHLDEDDEVIGLEEQLKIYREYYEASKKIDNTLKEVVNESVLAEDVYNIAEENLERFYKLLQDLI